MALKPSKRCHMVYSYGICERCDRCGYMTRREKYNNLKEYSQELYCRSKSNEDIVNGIITDIYNFDFTCREISQMLEERNIEDKNIRRLLFKVKILSKIAKKIEIFSKKLIKEVEEVKEISKLIENKIDF